MKFVKNVKLESGMPALVISDKDGNMYGLIPYRKYDFSIVNYNEEKNTCGDHCIVEGLQPVIFSDICNGMRSIGKYNYIVGQAASCLCNFSAKLGEPIPEHVHQSWTPNTFNMFIKDCFEWIFPNDEFPYMI